MISHDRAQELISARMDAPLPPRENRELYNHLAECAACRYFAAETDELSRALHALVALGPSPRVSRGVMTAIEADDSGWAWLRRGLQFVSSPGMAAVSAVALVVALASAIIVALNAPGELPGNNAEGTIAAVAVAPLPTEIPTPTAIPEPTATQPPQRTVAPAAAAPTRTPVPQPTATSEPTVEVAAAAPAVEPSIAPVVDQPTIVPASEDPALAMATEQVDSGASTDLAQAAEPDTASTTDQSSQAAPDTASTTDQSSQAAPDNGQGTDSGRKRDNRHKESSDGGTGSDSSGGEAAPQPAPTEAAPIPDQAVTAMENAESSGAVSLPPAPLMPMPPSQAFLPITPTPVDQSTPSPDTGDSAEAPQVAEQPNSDTTVNGDNTKNRERRKKSDNGGNVSQQQQTAYVSESLGWSSQSLTELQIALEPQVADEPTSDTQATDEPTSDATETAAAEGAVPDGSSAEAGTVDESADGTDASGAAATSDASEQPREIDPATGYEIDPATGYLIDPTTGYLLDVANNRIIDPRTGYQVHPFTGLLIDPATGALLDPVTLQVVVPAGFGSDSPDYVPGDSMRGQIEGVVDSTYDNATYKLEPATDGPTQPVDQITVPTESGDSIEIGNDG